MKNNKTNFLTAIILGSAIALSTAVNAQAPVIYKNDSAHVAYTINSVESYAKIESSMNAVLLKLQNVYQQYPNFEYKPLYNTYGELIAMSVNGVTESPVAKEIAFYLIELESLGNAMRFADMAYLPNVENEKDGRLTRKEEKASRMRTEINLQPALANTETISISNKEHMSRGEVKSTVRTY